MAINITLFFPQMDLVLYKFSDKHAKRNVRNNRYCHVDTWSRLPSCNTLTYLLTYVLTYLLHGAQFFFRNSPVLS